MEFFGRPLRTFWDNFTGFDVIRFDDKIVKSGDRACSEVLLEKWGIEAVTLIKQLIHIL